MLDSEIVGRNIKKIRKDNKLTQEEFGNIICLTKQSISNIEKGKTYPTLETLDIIGNKFNININTLIYTSFYKKSNDPIDRYNHSKETLISIMFISFSLILISFILTTLIPLQINNNRDWIYWYIDFSYSYQIIYNIYFCSLIFIFLFSSLYFLYRKIRFEIK